MLWVYKNKDNNFDYIKSDRKPNASAQLVASNLWNEPVEFLVASESEEINEAGQIYIKYSVVLDQGAKDAAAAEKALVQARRDAFAQLNTDIELDAATTSGTTNFISAIFDLFTYLRMKERPELFDQEGLVAKKDVASFSQGDALDTDLKVRQYAEAMIADSDAFMIRRLKKITEFLNN